MDAKLVNMNMKDATVLLVENYIEDPEALYTEIDESSTWSTFDVRVYGKVHKQPRLSFYQADDRRPYKYAGFDRTPQAWTEPVRSLATEIEDLMRAVTPTHAPITGALGNKYVDGNHYIGPHSDDKKDLFSDSFIASISLGATRDFVFVHKTTKERIVIPLKSGTLLLMGPGTQENWKHSVPVRKKCTEPRINITYRSVAPRGMNDLLSKYSS